MPHLQSNLVSDTLSDCAWCVSLQEFLIRLVRLITSIELNLRFKVFVRDGLMSVLDDYLQAKPAGAAEDRRLCKSCRLHNGRRILLADEFPISPGSRIRSLRVGGCLGWRIRVSHQSVVCHGFGYIAQLLQILRGFGIDIAFFLPGIGFAEDGLKSEFIWRPDGSSVTTVLLP